MRPASMSEHRIEVNISQQLAKMTSGPEHSPGAAKPHGTEIINRVAGRQQGIAKPAGETQPELPFHHRNHVLQTSQAYEQSLDPSKHVARTKVQHSQSGTHCGTPFIILSSFKI